MTTPYERGRRLEYKCVNELRESAFGAQRTAGSHSPFDVIAWSQAGVRLIQVKRSDDPTRFASLYAQADDAWAGTPVPNANHISRELWIWDGTRWNCYDLDTSEAWRIE